MLSETPMEMASMGNLRIPCPCAALGRKTHNTEHERRGRDGHVGPIQAARRKHYHRR